MFRAETSWVALVVGVTAVVTREYLRRPKMARGAKAHRDREELRRELWENRDTYLDNVLLHDCQLRQVTIHMIEGAGWHLVCFTMAALANDKAVLCD